jgi:O-antigen ligase
MIARRRVSSLEDAAQIIRRHPSGERIGIEALHAGDPLPVDFVVTEGLQAKANPLGVSVDGRSRRFRVSGFTRHFVTYAEQMQIMALLIYGALLAGLKSRRESQQRLWVSVCIILFVLFSLALILTASRSVIIACLFAIITVSIIIGNRRMMLIALAAAIAIGGVAFYTLRASRALSVISFTDDSSERRIGYMRAGLRVIPQYPLLGVGMDAHKRLWKELGFPGDYITHTHSTPIQIAMDRGLPAFGCYVWLIAAMVTLTWRGYAQAKRLGDEATGGLMLGAFAALIGFSASSLVNYNFGDAETLMMLLLIIGLSIVARKKQSRQSEESEA